jgi:hypothetical protein
MEPSNRKIIINHLLRDPQSLSIDEAYHPCRLGRWKSRIPAKFPAGKIEMLVVKTYA